MKKKDQEKDLIKCIEEAKREWEITIDSLDHIILLLNKNGNILRGNKAVEKWGLFNVQSLRGLNFHRILHPGCNDQDCYLKNSWNQANDKLKNGDPYIIESHDNIINKYLRIKFTPISSELSKNEKSDIFSIIRVMDITERKKNEDKINQLYYELKVIFDILQYQYVKLDLDGKILDIKGIKENDRSFISEISLGKLIYDLFPVSGKAELKRAFSNVRNGSQLEIFEYNLKSDSGDQIYEVKVIPLSVDSIVCIKNNITESRRLISMAQTIDLMQNLGTIFSGIRHEIGNPINAIKMTTSVLKRNFSRFSTDKILEYVDRIISETSRVEFLLNNLKNFNMFEKLNPEKIDIHEFIDNFIKLIKENFEEHGVVIRKPSFDKKLIAYIDPRAFHQVMLNITGNALDSVKNLDNPEVRFETKKKGDSVIIIISDNGTGVPESVQKDIFKPFFTTKSNGTGLGLSIVQKILTNMNGSIRIDSSALSGTKVIISISGGKKGE
ncbi:MAG: PAS domain-containing sensor histidine kinase [Acidobacteriota bacterium]